MFQQSGNVFPDKGLLKSNCKGLHTVCIVDFNILWLIQSGPMALLIGKTDLISITSDSSITMSARDSLQYKNIFGKDLPGFEMLEIQQKYLFKI